MADDKISTSGTPDHMVAERSFEAQPTTLPSVVHIPNHKLHPFIQRKKAAKIIQKYRHKRRAGGKGALRKAVQRESVNAVPVKKPTNNQRVKEINEDVLDIQTDDLRDLIGLSRGQLLKRSTLKPELSTGGQIVYKPDPIPKNSVPNTRRIVRMVVKAPPAGSVASIQTQTHVESQSKGIQQGQSDFQQVSVGTQTDESCIEAIKRGFSVRVEPANPTHVDHTFKFGSHGITVAPPPQLSATRTSGAYAQQQQQLYVSQQQFVQPPQFVQPHPYPIPPSYQPTLQPYPFNQPSYQPLAGPSYMVTIPPNCPAAQSYHPYHRAPRYRKPNPESNEQQTRRQKRNAKHQTKYEQRHPEKFQ